MSNTPPYQPTQPTGPGYDPSRYANPTQPPRPPIGGIAISALVVGIVAFMTGLVPGLGLALGIAGIVLGVMGIRRATGRWLSITGLVLSGIATLCNLVVVAVLVVTIAIGGAAGSAFSDGFADALEDSEMGPGPTPDAPGSGDVQTIDTPCFSFDGPADFINDVSSDTNDGCITELELWGELNPDGTITNTGVGAVWGSVNVEATRVDFVNELAPDGSLAGIVEALNEEYIPSLGTVLSEEPVTLDGAEASLTRVESTSETTQTKALIVVLAPESYTLGTDEVQLFLISVVIPDDTGDEVIETVLESWEWK